jgi:hypothetical protein
VKRKADRFLRILPRQSRSIQNDNRLLRGWTEQDAVTRPPAPPARHYITANGRTLALKAWAKKLGVGASVIRGRLALGWTETDAVTLPVHQGHYCKRRTR